MSDLVGNPNCWVSLAQAQMSSCGHASIAFSCLRYRPENFHTGRTRVSETSFLYSIVLQIFRSKMYEVEVFCLCVFYIKIYKIDRHVLTIDYITARIKSNHLHQTCNKSFKKNSIDRLNLFIKFPIFSFFILFSMNLSTASSAVS